MLNLFIYLIVMSITPGPNTILAMANASEVGFARGLPLNLGMFAGIAIDMLAAYYASRFLSRWLPEAEMMMKILGALYMVYLAWKTWRKKEISGERKRASFAEGLVLQLVNVKVLLLAITAINSYILPICTDNTEALMLSFSIPIVCLLSGLVWALGGALLSKVYNRHRTAINGIFALALLYCAVRIFV